MDIRVDYAFKYILGHKEILLKLLNDFLPIGVEDIEYGQNELPVNSEKDKRSAFDVLCTERNTGAKFLCEMQQIQDTDMDDRLLFYGCSLIHMQIERGNPEYLLKPVYVICFSNYIRKHDVPVPEDKIIFNYRLIEPQLNDEYGNKLNFYIVELPRLKQVWENLETKVEQWCYLFNNLSTFAEVPANSEHFNDLFEVARTGGLDKKELTFYIYSMVTEYDKRVIGNYFLNEGIVIGTEKGSQNAKLQIAQSMLSDGIDIDFITKYTGLTLEDIEKIN